MAISARTIGGAAAFTALWIWAAEVRGHGTAIVVHAASGQLTVSNGTPDPVGYAPWVFADDDPEAWLTPGPGPSLLTTLPGFDIHGLGTGAEVFLEVLPRPDFSQEGQPLRWLWHWSMSTGETALAAADPNLQLISIRGFLPSATLVQEATPAVTSVKLAAMQANDHGVHRHLALYRLDDAGPADLGVYGFFARISSPGWAPTEPFLVALNNGLDDATTFLQGALELNVAAGLAGDFDDSGAVDGGDFLLWQRSLGPASPVDHFAAADASLDGVVDGADLAIWSAQYGRTVAFPPEALPAGAALPEPAAMLLAALGSLALRRRRAAPPSGVRRGQEHPGQR
ncbi:MAG TPA: hypothetical protein PJ982_16445 [Lacipirellulaceae bacterium]|nr:hypothetical protein [Lacipirellulaceae bacterium]